MKVVKNPVAVIDTNVLLVSISSKSKYHWLYRSLIAGQFRLGITQDILLEYEEIIGAHWSASVAKDVVRSITELPNTSFVPVYYQLHLIAEDEDDNKFVDCAFAANAHCIVTHDRHFQVLAEVDFPRIPVVDIHGFRALLE